MSHYTLTVVLPPGASSLGPDHLHQQLEKALAPYNEHTRVPRYKEYETGKPDMWRHWDKKFQARLARVAAGATPTWAMVVQAQNAPTQELSLIDESANEADDGRLFLDDAGAYTYSTYNPDSKWDGWVIGGRWHAYYQLKPDAVAARGAAQVHVHAPGAGNGCRCRSCLGTAPPSDAVVLRATGGDPRVVLADCDTGHTCRRNGLGSSHIGWADAAPIECIDLDGMRAAAYNAAATDHEHYSTVVAGLPAPLGFKACARELGLDPEADLEPHQWDSVRQVYWAQPAVKAMDAADIWADSSHVEALAAGKEAFATRAATRAVPTFAMLGDGHWVAPGSMGWFGMDDATTKDKDQYYAAANQVLDGLPGATVLALIDCHI